MKKLLATSALALAIAGTGALGLPTVAGAATTTTPPAPARATGAHHGLRVWLEAHRRGIREELVSVSASTIGIQPQELVTELRSGMSIADVATRHDVTAQTVVDALVKAFDTRVQAAVTDGKITAARGQEIEGRLPSLATLAVNHVFGQHAGTQTPASAAG